MTSLQLIRTTLKYLMAEENGQKKYRFQVYDPNSTQSPVMIITVADLFSVAINAIQAGKEGIPGVKKRLETIKKSLITLGTQALTSTINSLQQAATAVQVVTVVEQVYRIARPIVVSAADIGDIIWNVPAIAKMAQDVLQYLSRIAIGYARKYLQMLWEKFLRSPVFAIYANEYTIGDDGNIYTKDEDGNYTVLDFSEEYQYLYDQAIDFLNLLLQDDTLIDDVIRITNDYIAGDGKYITTPGIDRAGVIFSEDIQDVYFNNTTKAFYVATASKIYSVDIDSFEKTLVCSFDSTKVNLGRIFYEDGSLFFVDRSTTTLHLGSAIYKVTGSSSYVKYGNSFANEISDIIFSDYGAYIVTDNFVYDKDHFIIFQSANNIVKAYYKDGIIYYAEQTTESETSIANVFYTLLDIKSYTRATGTYVTGLKYYKKIEEAYNAKEASGVYYEDKKYYKKKNDIYVLLIPGTDYIVGNKITESYYEKIEGEYKLLVESEDYQVGATITGNDIYKINASGFSKEKIVKITDAEVLSLSYLDGYIYVAISNTTKTNFDIKKLSSSIGFSITNFKTSGGETVDACYVENGYIASGHSIYSYTESDLSKNIELETNSLPVEINSVTKHRYYPDSTDEENYKDFYICTSGYGFLVSEIDSSVIESGFSSEDWKLKNLFYDSDYEPEELDTLMGSFWDNNDFYYYSQNRIFKINAINTSQLFEDIEDIEPYPLDDIPEPREPYIDELWTNEDVYMITNGVRYSQYDDALSGFRILKAKKIGDNIMVSMCKDSDQTQNGIFWYYPNAHLFNRDFATPNIRVYDFAYTDETWYLVNAEAVYQFREGDQIRKLEDASNFISSEKVIVGVTYDSSSDPVVFLNNGYLLKSYEAGIHTVDTDISIDKTHELKTVCTQNSIMFSDYNYNYNILKEKISDKEVYQILSKKYSDSTNKLIQSYDSAFIVENKMLSTVPMYQAIKSHDYHCGYYTDSSVHSWAGAAPYYLSSNVLNNKSYKYLKEEYIDLYRQSFKDELDKLLKNAPDAFIDIIKQKITAYLESLDVTISGDNQNAIIDACIESISGTISLSVGIYIVQHFSEKLSDTNAYETFAEAVAQLCYNDPNNDMTKDFYEVFKSLLKSIIQDIEISYNSIDLEDWLITYYQTHKYDWEESITTLTNKDKVADSIIFIPIEAEESFETWDDSYHQMFYDNLTTAKNAIKNYTPAHGTDNISDRDRENIKAIFDAINYNPSPNDDWQNVIKEVVKYYYIPTQGQQYRDIVTESNMYPIQWSELPAKINHDAFDTALNLLLDTIKAKINEMITWLVDSGQVKCYSCVTPESIIERMMEESAKIYRNQELSIYNTVNQYTTWTSLKADLDTIFNVIHMSKPTKSLLSRILSEQSELYAKYIKKIVYKYVIENDEEVEVEQ